MSALDGIIPSPRLVEVDSVDLAVLPERAWQILRQGDLGLSPLVRALFAIRTLPSKVTGKEAGPPRLAIDDMQSTPERPGFQVLADGPPEVVVGAIGKVWHLSIPFVNVEGADRFAAFQEPGFVKVAWAIRVEPLGDHDAHVVVELRVDATDEVAWKRFRRYFRLIGPGSHFIRRSLLSSLARDHGTPESAEAERPLPGDELLPDAAAQATHGITLAAPPEAVWPWLVQMGCQRAGFYSIDRLDNDGVPSARQIHPELQRVAVGDVIPATPHGKDGFEVLQLEPNRVLALGGLYDAAPGRQLPFRAARPQKFWQTTWTFVLEPLGGGRTRLHVRARAAFSEDQETRAFWMRPAHWLMQSAQLRHLRARVEGWQSRDGLREVVESGGGAVLMVAAFLTPFLRRAREHWGLDRASAERCYPGDERIGDPRFQWVHGVEIDAPVEEVWQWVAQIGADRAGFYSYQWLENLVGCEIQNAERVNPEWAMSWGRGLRLHPSIPPLPVVDFRPGHWFVAYLGDTAGRATGKPWVEASWALIVEPLGALRCRAMSRFRSACSDDMATRLRAGPFFLEPVGFAMDRRMLLGLKERAERRVRSRHAVHRVAAGC